MKLDKISAVLKLTERCNINCTYCYMFNKDSDLYASKPKQMSLDVATRVARFLAEGARSTGARTVQTIFHGGEPMMMRPADFDRLCQVFIDEISPFANVQYTIQTNAMLVDDRWLAIFSKYGMGVGVSLDGDRAANDRNRIDHAGLGTYERAVSGARRLFEASKQGRISPPAALCVIDPEENGAATFRHLVGEVGFKWIDFLLPIDMYDDIGPKVAAKVGRYLMDVFDAWRELDAPDVSVRFFDQFYTFMTGVDRRSGKALPRSRGGVVITVASDGTYGPDDTLRIVSDNYYRFDSREMSLVNYLSTPDIAELERASVSLPASCDDCVWAAYCLGGATNGRIVNRYRPGTKFPREVWSLRRS